MPLPIVMTYTCPKCGYTTTGTVSDASPLSFKTCPKCGTQMRGKPDGGAGALGGKVSDLLKKLFK